MRRISESAMPSGLPAVRAATSRSFKPARTKRTVDSVRVSFARIAAFSRSVKASRIQSSEWAASRRAYKLYFAAANSQGIFLSRWKSGKFHRRWVDKQSARRIFGPRLRDIPLMEEPTAAWPSPRPPDCNAALVLADGMVFWRRGVGATGQAARAG